MDWVTASISLIVTAIAAVIDFKTGRIPNYLTFPSILFGVIYAYLLEPGNGFERLLLLIILFVIGGFNIFGMGDLKLVMAIGALNGTLCLGITVALAAILVIVADLIRHRQNAWIDIHAGLKALSEFKFNRHYGTGRSVKFAPYLFIGLVIGVVLCGFLIN